MTLSKEYTTGFVTSKDGTKIGFRQLGSGSGLILVHGGMMASQNLMKLAKVLSDEFTVYIPDRRGRGLSGPHGKSYSLSAETEDIQALIYKTNTQNIFGLSSGAIIALQSAIIELAIKKVAIYEPPIPVNGTKPAAWVDKYELAMSKGNFGEALISIVRGTGDSSLLSIIPSFITIPFMNLAIKADAKDRETKIENEVPLKTLISTMHFDAKIVLESEGIINKCKNISAEILLLGGQRSQDYLKVALNALSDALPLSKRIEFSGLGHLAAEDGGKPKVVAKELLSFFRTTNIK